MLDNLGNLFPKPPGDLSRGEFAGFVGIFAAVLWILYLTGVMPIAVVPVLLCALLAFFVAWAGMAFHQYVRQHDEQEVAPTPLNRATVMIEELRDRAEELGGTITMNGNGTSTLDAAASFSRSLETAANNLEISLERYNRGLLTGSQLDSRVDDLLELLERPVPALEAKRRKEVRERRRRQLPGSQP